MPPISCHVEMALAEGALGRLAHRGEGRHQNVVQRLAVGELFSNSAVRALSASSDRRRSFRLKGVNGVDPGLVSLDPPVVGGAEKLAGERADHAKFLFSRFGKAAVRWSTWMPINSS